MNIAGLQLARAAALSRDTAVRVALGASRARLIRESLLQAGWLTAAGAGLGILLALAARGALAALVPRVPLPVDLPIAFGWRVMAFAAAIATAAGVTFALLTAWRASRPDAIGIIRSGGGAGRTGVTRRVLIVAQIAFSVTALASAGILIRSLTTAANVPLGFADPARIALLSTDLSFMGPDASTRDAEVARWLASIRALPGVRHAALGSVAPLGFGGAPPAAVQVDGYAPAPNETTTAGRVVVSDGYFDTMEMRVVDGRALSDADGASAERVAVVNAAFAARYSPGRSAIGRRIDHGGGWAVIVGVAADARFDSLTDPVRPIVFHPLAQAPQSVMTLHVASTAAAGPPIDTLRRATADVHPDLPLLDPGTLADHIGAATFSQAIGARVLTIMGIIAVFMAATGIYGLAASFVDERQREIAITVALGARPRAVAGTVAGPPIRLAIAGLATGVPGAVAVSILLRSQLTGLPAIDVWSLLAVTTLLSFVVGATCVPPIRRALRIDPVTTLRAQ
jgi:predicted permease